MAAMIAGQATAEGTARYVARFPDLPAEHFRELQGARLSTVGLGTYLGAGRCGDRHALSEGGGAGGRARRERHRHRDQLSQPAERARGGRGAGGGDPPRGAPARRGRRRDQGRLPGLRQQRAVRSARVLHDDVHPLRHHPAGRYRRLALHDATLPPRPARPQPGQSRPRDGGRLLPPQSRDPARRGECAEVSRAPARRVRRARGGRHGGQAPVLRRRDVERLSRRSRRRGLSVAPRARGGRAGRRRAPTTGSA